MMEGLLPFLYRAILHLASGGETPLGNPFCNDESSSPDASHYVCLAAAGARPLRPLMLAARHATEILGPEAIMYLSARHLKHGLSRALVFQHKSFEITKAAPRSCLIGRQTKCWYDRGGTGRVLRNRAPPPSKTQANPFLLFFRSFALSPSLPPAHTAMALVSATASLHLPVPSAVIGGSAACSFPQLRRPLPAPLRAAKGANSSPVVLGSKVKGKKKKGSGAGNLSGALDVEIREAQESLDRDEQEPVPDNFPFEIIDEEGMSVVILKRDYKDEKIEVIVSMPNLEGGPEFDDEDGEDDVENAGKDDEEEDDESAGDSSISLKVVVSKGSGPKLEFTCTAFREEITIDDMLMVEKTVVEGEEKFPYEGPEFTELPVNVQKGLFKFMEQRGITLSATNYMHDYMVTKQNQEYVRWMRKLKDFVKQ